MRLLILSFFILFHFTSFGQTNHYQNLLDTAIGRHSGLFVSSKPINHLRLDNDDMRMYVENLRDWSNQHLDTAMFSQIILNAKVLDSTLWKDIEIPFALLVNDRDETVTKKYAIQKFSLTDKKQIKFYSKQINQFNSTEAYDRNISYFSRPVFDNSKIFAVVQWDNGHSRLGGGGGIILYQLYGDIWKEVGIINNWRY